MRSALGLLAFAWAIGGSAAAQPAVTAPDISGITFTGGTAHVAVSGALEVQAEIPLSAEDTMTSRGITWLVFGTYEAPVRATLVYGPDGAGLNVERGEEIAEVSYPSCTGESKMEGAVVSGQYTCDGAVYYDLSSPDNATGSATITIRFTAR